jgi:uncharacterized protein YdaU (DUF1376 family)
MAKDPAFLLYSSDFLTGTFTMSNEQVGMYIRLLCLQHQKGVLSEEDMKKICTTYDSSIYEKFIKSEDGYYNQRLKEESQKRKAFCDSRRTNRLKKHTDKTSDTYEKHMSPHMEDENENENRIEDESSIVSEVFSHIAETTELNIAWNEWKEYKHTQFKFKYKTRKSEIIALKNLQTISNGKINEAIDIIRQSISNGWKGLFPIKSEQSKSNRSQQRFDARIEYANRHNQ